MCFIGPLIGACFEESEGARLERLEQQRRKTMTEWFDRQVRQQLARLKHSTPHR
jgi:hypothetical protein